MRSTRSRLVIGVATLLVASFTHWLPADAALPSLSVADAQVVEEAAVPSAQVRIRLSATSTTAVSVGFLTVEGSAIGGNEGTGDYTNASGRLTIPAGAAFRDVSIPIVADDRVEGDESFFVRLFDPTGATIADGSGTVVIHDAATDRDPPPALVESKAVLEGDTDTSVSVLVRLGAYSATAQTVTVEAGGSGSATAGQDYEETTAVLQFPAGTRTRRFSVPILGDQLDEAPETFRVAVVDDLSTTVPWNGANDVTIYDDDEPSSK